MPPTRPSASPRTFRSLGPVALAPLEAVARPVGLLRALRPDDDPIVSWSTVATPALVLGRSARATPIDMRVAERAGVTVVRRTSGGGPVLWDHDLIALDVVLPPGHPLAPADVVETYRWLGEAMAGALEALGAPRVEVVAIADARHAARAPGAAADACYGGISPFEVLVDGRKVVGLSQARRQPGTLLQAGILLKLDARLLSDLMGRDEPFAAALANHAAGLGEWLPAVTAGDLIEAVNTQIVERGGHSLILSDPTTVERAAIVAATREIALLRT